MIIIMIILNIFPLSVPAFSFVGPRLLRRAVRCRCPVCALSTYTRVYVRIYLSISLSLSIYIYIYIYVYIYIYIYVDAYFVIIAGAFLVNKHIEQSSCQHRAQYDLGWYLLCGSRQYVCMYVCTYLSLSIYLYISLSLYIYTYTHM